MLIGIHAKGAFRYNRTSVEEYVHQLVKHIAMLDEAKEYSFRLYTTTYGRHKLYVPDNFTIKKISRFPFGSAGYLSLNMLFASPDVLFMPMNFLPAFYPKKSVVTIHGLEFESHPEFFSRQHLDYLRDGTKRSVRYAERIIVPSQAVKNDLVSAYHANPEKVTVIYHGANSQIAYHHRYPPIDEKYILFIGRLEKKKNVCEIIKAFDVLKEKHKIPHKLVLVGMPGHGYEEIQKTIDESLYKMDVVVTGFIQHEEKESFFKYADVFVFPSLYEGFGMSVLEAQLRGVPVVASRIPGIAEITDGASLLVDPQSVEELTEAILKVVTDPKERKRMVAGGVRNAQRYSWVKCAKQTLELLGSL